MKLRAISLCIASLIIAGCGRENTSTYPTASPPEANSGAYRPSKDSLPVPIKRHLSPDTTSSIKLSQAELNHPLDKYSSLDGEPMALTYLVTALNVAPVSDEEKLSRLSPDWFSTADVFKRQELAKTELPRINAKLDKYREQHYYSIPIASMFNHEVAVPQITLDSYDLNSKSFPLGVYGAHCWNGLYRNTQQAQLELRGDIVPCKLPVGDENVARSIEAARAANSLQIGGTVYIFVSQAQGGVAQGVVTAAKIQLSDKQTKVPLGNFELRPLQ